MKSYLLDTHIFLNAYGEPKKIGPAIKRILTGNSPKYISAIPLISPTLWVIQPFLKCDWLFQFFL